MPSPDEKRLPPQAAQSVVQLGLRANWQQFTLLVIVNAFVGGMVGLERSIVPLRGQRVFGLVSTTAVLSFIVSFGVVKAAANLFAGRLSDRIGRKGVLVVGWLVGLPVPFLIIFAPSWGWVVFANVLLGINQGLCWSTTVIMKIDLVGPARRGLAMGINEAAGYIAVSLAAIAAGYLAATYALRPQPFLLGIGFALAGLLLSLLFVRESHGHARHEAALLATAAGQTEGSAEQVQRPDHRPATPSFKEIFWLTSWKSRTLFGVSQAGLVNNLNDGLAWGGISALFCRRRSSSRADRAAGGHLSGRVGDDAVADRGALRPHWAQRHDCRGDAASGLCSRAVAAAPRVWVVGTHDGPAWAGDGSGLSNTPRDDRRCRSPRLACVSSRRLPALARQRIRHRGAAFRGTGRPLRGCLRHRRHRWRDLPFRGDRPSVHVQ